MNCKYSNTIAIKCGINAALIAGYISKVLSKTNIAIDGVPWVGITQKCLTGIFPFMGEKAVRNAVRRLKRANIIHTKQFMKNNFNHTYFYTFTSYGNTILKGEDVNAERNKKN